MSIDKCMITTAFELPGYKVVESLGIVRGISVRSLSFGRTFVAGWATLRGGKNTCYTELCEQTRQEALEILILHAQEVEANGIIGLRYDANEIMAGVTEVLAYGTAVVFEKE
jgi:uncharacterized protein YbjQ (UPF0145 family)